MSTNSVEGGSNIRHVLLVARWPVGGIRTFLKYVITFYPSSRYRFSLVGTATADMFALQEELGDRIDTWVLVPADGHEVTGLFKAVWKTINEKDVDLIHAHGFVSVITCCFSSIFFRLPLICTSHDVISLSQFQGVKGFIKRSILWLALKKCRLVHSVSAESSGNLVQMFPSLSSRCLTIGNGVDTRAFSSATPENLRARFSLSESAVIIGFFGRFMSPKGFRFLVDAASILSRTKKIGDFNIVCFGSGAFIREEQAEIERRGLKSLFVFVPFTSDVSGAMKGCDVIAMPSLWEASPLQPMEALSAGVPFVGSDCAGLRMVLEGTPAVIVKAGDAESLAKGIVNCLAKGRKPFEDYSSEAADRFDVRKATSEIHKMYEKVLA